MDFNKVALFGTYISKDYSKDILVLLMKYNDISASEAASRLNLHIKTVQDFLEAMTELEIVFRAQVTDRKRPYYRYSIKSPKINISTNLIDIEGDNKVKKDYSEYRIREKNYSGARFNTARYDSYFNSVVIWLGNGRERKERKFNLTIAQGKVLFNLPFPGAEPASIIELIDKSGIDKDHISEIMDIVDILIKNNVIEKL